MRKKALQQITIEIPEKVLLAKKTDAESFGREILILAAIKLFEIAGFVQDVQMNSQSRVEFLLSLNRYKVSPFAAKFNDL